MPSNPQKGTNQLVIWNNSSGRNPFLGRDHVSAHLSKHRLTVTNTIFGGMQYDLEFLFKAHLGSSESDAEEGRLYL